MQNQLDDGTLGRLTKVEESEVRRSWEREEKFSQWMRDNIDVLNEVLGLEVDIAEAESPVGSFRLDLAGNDSHTQKPVVIENQFGKINHDHLGKLITYSAGREAGILIWLAGSLRIPTARRLNG